jgi:hypothetical protein
MEERGGNNLSSFLQISLGGKAHGFNRGMKAFLF